MRLDELEAIARAATPGEWFVHDALGHAVAAVASKRIAADALPPKSPAADSTYIAAFSPARVLAMLAIVRAAKHVAYSNGFDAALPDKQERLRTALAAFDEMEGK
jgi:hypothetical protein